MAASRRSLSLFNKCRRISLTPSWFPASSRPSRRASADDADVFVLHNSQFRQASMPRSLQEVLKLLLNSYLQQPSTSVGAARACKSSIPVALSVLRSTRAYRSHKKRLFVHGLAGDRQKFARREMLQCVCFSFARKPAIGLSVACAHAKAPLWLSWLLSDVQRSYCSRTSCALRTLGRFERTESSTRTALEWWT